MVIIQEFKSFCKSVNMILVAPLYGSFHRGREKTPIEKGFSF